MDGEEEDYMSGTHSGKGASAALFPLFSSVKLCLPQPVCSDWLRRYSDKCHIKHISPVNCMIDVNKSEFVSSSVAGNHPGNVSDFA